jgi:hypothetical protein
MDPGAPALLPASHGLRRERLILEKGDQRSPPTSRNSTRYGAPVICYRDRGKG